MLDPNQLPPFQVVVSEKTEHSMGIGTTQQKSESHVYYFAEKNNAGKLYIQALNGNHVPAGRKTYLEESEFSRRFKPEPLIYYNTVKPALDGLDQALDKADRHRKAERFDKAQQVYQTALSMDPDNMRAIFGMGLASLGMGSVEEATQVFEKLMSLEFAFATEHKHLFNEFGIRMRKAGMLVEAKQWYSKALQCCRLDSHLFYNLGRVQFEMADCAAAAQSLEQALEIDPELKPASKLLCAVRKTQKKTQAAA